MAFQTQNFYEDTLSAPIGSNDLIIPITNPPSVSEGWMLIDWDIPSKREFVYFTGRTATTITLSSISGRGVDQTSSRSHDQGAKVRMNVNAAMLAGLRDGSALNGIGSSNIAPGGINFVNLVSTIFGSQVQTMANAGNAGGTINYINLGGVKLAWGITPVLAPNGNTEVIYNVTLPAAFFTNITGLTYQNIAASGSVGNNILIGNAYSSSTFSFYVRNNTGSNGVGGIVSWFAIGN